MMEALFHRAGDLRGNLLPGDLVLARNPMGIGKAINFWQRLWSSDGASVFGHAFLLRDRAANTLDTLWTVRSDPFFEKYAGHRVAIFRHTESGLQKKEAILDEIWRQAAGDGYPLWRLLLFVARPIARISYKGKFKVCSERAAYFFSRLGVWEGPYMGVTPDDLHDWARNHREFVRVFEGDIA